MEYLADFYKDKHVLVTGGCGFIGSHVVEKLVEVGAHVTVIDNLSSGSLENIASVKDRIVFLQESIVDRTACDRAVAGNEIIFHMAAYISVPGSVQDPTECHAVNVDGTFNVLQAARKHKVKRFVLSSTSAVYGPREDICYESDPHLNPVSPYGASKLMAELYCAQFSRLYNLPCVILRYFNVYGSRQDPHSPYAAVVASFQYQMENNKPLTIFGDGHQTRDFIHAEKVAEANLVVGMAPQELVDRECYNIGTGKSISLLQLAKEMKRNFPGYTEKTQFLPARDGDVKHTQMSALKFRALKQKLFNQERNS